jgi:hypothetical protein
MLDKLKNILDDTKPEKIIASIQTDRTVNEYLEELLTQTFSS